MHKQDEAIRTGIRNPVIPDAWLVPPWPVEARVHELVQHFHRFQPAIHACSAIQAAYYSRYAAVLAAMPTAGLLDTFSWRWYEELLSAVHRCAESAEAEHEQALDSAQQTIQLTLVRTLGINSRPIEGQAD
jgi:hypothetical protein